MADYIFPYGEAPDDAEFVVTEPNQNLPNAKDLIAGANITIDVGPDTVTISSTGGAGGDETFITATDETASLPNSFRITSGANVTLDYVGNELIISAQASGSGGGTVQSVSSGNAPPLFSTNVATATTTPSISYTLTNAASGTFLGGTASGAAGAPTYRGILGTDLLGALLAGSNITISPAPAPGSRLTLAAVGLQQQSNILNSLSTGLSGTGYITQTGPTSFAERTFQGSTYVELTNPAGLAGDTTISLTPSVFTSDTSALLNALSSATGNGLLTRTGTTTVASRTITGSTNITVGNGDGVGANPSIDVTSRVFTVATSTLLNALSSSTSGGTGGIYQLSDASFINRSLTGTSGRIVITNPLGLSGNPTFDVGSDVYTISSSNILNAFATSSGTGMLAQNGASFAYRTITGTLGEVNVSGGNGTSNPTISLDPSVVVNKNSNVLNALATSNFPPGNGAVLIGGSGTYQPGNITSLPGVQVTLGAGLIQIGASGALGGTVTSFSADSFAPVYNTSVDTATTTPHLAVILNQQASGASLIGPINGANDEPTFRRLLGDDLTDAVKAGANITLELSNNQIVISSTASGGGGGTVTDVISGNANPLFITNVTTSTTTPTISYTLSNAASGTFFGAPATGGDGPGTYRGILGTDLAGALAAGTNITLTPASAPGSRITIALSSGIDATFIANGSVDNTEFQFLNGVTSGIQGQLDGKQPLNANLTDLAGVSTNGVIAYTGSNDFQARAITGTANRLSVTNGTGAAGNPTIDVGTDVYTISSSNVLNDLASSTSTGVVVQTDSIGHHAYRTLTGTANEVTVTNGSGIGGDPTFSLPTGINVTKLADGSVDNTEFQFLNGVTSSIQTQLDGKLVSAGDLAPVFTTTESSGNINFLLNNVPSGSFFAGPASGADGPWANRGILGTDLTGALEAGSNITLALAPEPGSRLIISSTGSTGYATVEEEGSPLTQRSTINFVGDGITAADVSSKTQVSLDATLNSLASYNTDGLLTQTATDTFTGRTLTGTGTNITVTNGNGVSGNPTVDVGANVYTRSQSSLLNHLASATPSLGQVPMGDTDGSYILTKPNAGSGIQLDFANGVFTISATGAGTGGGYATIQEEGSPLTQRTILDVVGTALTASDTGSKTQLTAHTSVNSIAVTPTNGQIPIGNGTNFTVTSPTAGQGIQLSLGSGILNISASGAGQGYENKTSSFTAVAGWSYGVDSSGGAITVTLPTAVGCAGQEIYVSLQTAGNSLTFNTTSSQTIDGIASGALSTSIRYNGYLFKSNGTNWMML